MIYALRAALIDRLAQAAPGLHRHGLDDHVGFWVEDLEFGPTDHQREGWEQAMGAAGHVVAELVPDLLDDIGPALLLSLWDSRLAIALPEDAAPEALAWGGRLDLLSRADGAAAPGVLVVQLRFRFTGGVYRRLDPAVAPSALLVSRAPDIGPAHQDAYTDLLGEDWP